MAQNTPHVESSKAPKEAYQGPWFSIITRFMRHRLAMGSLMMLLVVITVSWVGPWFSPFTQRDQSLKQKNLPPLSTYTIERTITNADGSIRTPKDMQVIVYTGTDELGRDLLTRLLYAGRVSLYIAFAVTVLSEAIAIIVGVIAGYFRKGVDAFIMRLVDFLDTLPLLPILLLITTLVKPNITLLIVILVAFGWTSGTRLMRGQILSLREQEYVLASRALGGSNLRIMLRHLIPNALAPNIVNASLGLSGVMITEAALSFLGFGVQLPAASWGNMLRDAGSAWVLETYFWRAFFPGLAIFICSLCFNFIGDGLRDALDPRTTR